MAIAIGHWERLAKVVLIAVPPWVASAAHAEQALNTEVVGF
jgi:hypothetical protein